MPTDCGTGIRTLVTAGLSYQLTDGGGLQILRLEEGRTIPWKFAPRMVAVPDGFALPESERDLVPCTYTIIVRKAGE